MFIIDFDGTLFDTYRFVQDRMGVLTPMGITKGLYQDTYKMARNTVDGQSVYSDKKHAQILAIQGFDENKVYQALSEVTINAKLYVFPDTFIFLESLKKHRQDLILLSLGDPAFQEDKINKTGIHKYFDRLFMVKDTKAHVLRKLFQKVKKNKVWFINDKVDETKKLAKEFSQLQAVLKFSPFFPEKEYKESGLPYFFTLTEILKYVEENS